MVDEGVGRLCEQQWRRGAAGTAPPLLAAAAPSLTEAHSAAAAAGQSARGFAETSHQAKSWCRACRVIFKAEVVAHPGRDLRANPRVLVTNLRHVPETVYARIHAARGDSPEGSFTSSQTGW